MKQTLQIVAMIIGVFLFGLVALGSVGWSAQFGLKGMFFNALFWLVFMLVIDNKGWITLPRAQSGDLSRTVRAIFRASRRG